MFSRADCATLAYCAGSHTNMYKPGHTEKKKKRFDIDIRWRISNDASTCVSLWLWRNNIQWKYTMKKIVGKQAESYLRHFHCLRSSVTWFKLMTFEVTGRSRKIAGQCEAARKFKKNKKNNLLRLVLRDKNYGWYGL